MYIVLSQVQGNVRGKDTLFSYRTPDKKGVTITQLPIDLGMCNLAPPAEVTRGRTLEKGHRTGRHAHRGDDERPEPYDRLDHRTHFHHHDHAHLDHDAIRRALETGPGPRPFLIYINMDATEGSNAQWGDVTDLALCSAANRSASGVQVLIDKVREDYAPFDVQVTANRGVYNSWTDNRIMVNVVANVALSGFNLACGIAYVGTYTQADNVAWVSCTCAGWGATGSTISHEVGHVFGLYHQGDATATPGTAMHEYLYGMPKYDKEIGVWPKDRRWNTIMGGSNDLGLTQWSDGQYPSSTNSEQDNVGIIRSATGDRPGFSCNQVGRSPSVRLS